MPGSTFGNLFRVTTFGESHGVALGCVVDGCPAGLSLCEEDIQKYLDRRKPGQSKASTARSESDTVHILSGVFEGKTTGTPIALEIRNADQHSKDYGTIATSFRPGHADFGFYEKYGFRDYRGGGRSSGRETVARVAAGAIAAKLLGELGVELTAYTKELGKVKIESFDKAEILNNPAYMPDAKAAALAMEAVDKARSEMDSLGGVCECVITGVKPGMGEPVFDKLDANLAKAMLSIGAVKGFEIGDGFEVAGLKGSTNNDSFTVKDGKTVKKTNHSGGTLGGMSDGSDIIFRVAFKPTPSIAKEQSTVNESGEEIKMEIKGRHDPVIVPRAVVVVETMAALVIIDAYLMNMTSRLEGFKKFYE